MFQPKMEYILIIAVLYVRALGEEAVNLNMLSDLHSTGYLTASINPCVVQIDLWDIQACVN